MAATLCNSVNKDGFGSKPPFNNWLYDPFCSGGANKETTVTSDLPVMTEFRWLTEKYQVL